jgi:hypothetical protein
MVARSKKRTKLDTGSDRESECVDEEKEWMCLPKRVTDETRRTKGVQDRLVGGEEANEDGRKRRSLRESYSGRTSRRDGEYRRFVGSAQLAGPAAGNGRRRPGYEGC